ncbi:MAG: tetratricopeptide repeat protein [Chitinophagaceae bacterium]
MKKPQWITISLAAILIITIFLFGRTVPVKKNIPVELHNDSDGHDHSQASAISIDSILNYAKKQLSVEQVTRLSMLESSISRGNVKDQQLKIYHQLSHFWGDSMRLFPPYAWYEAEAARLENSEKSLTFAARLFLEAVQQEENPDLMRWEALQAKDLYERSLNINPDNDSAKVGLGACYLFGNIASNPMEGISRIMEVVKKDSTNIYAQMTLAKGSVLSGQIDKAINRLHTVNRLEPRNLEAILMLAEVYERKGENGNSANWYRKSLDFIKRPDARAEIEKRIADLNK